MNKKIHVFLIVLSLFIHPNYSRAQTLLQDLPVVKDLSMSFSQSTYDRTGLNDDHITPLFHNYYDVIPQGKVNNPGGTATNKKEYVICHVTGPAVIERFWAITFPLYFDARFRFYFDGETTPRLSKTFNELFFVQSPPFVKPLVQNIYESSGGFWSYMRMPVIQSLIVTIDTAAVFCQFGVRQLARDTVVQSWTTAQDNSYLANEFNKSGTYPKDNAGSTVTDSIYTSLQPSQTLQVFSKNGSNVIEAIKMQLSQLDYSYSSFVKDKGNFHKGTSKFTLQINGNADTVLLIKRSNKFYHLDFNFKTLTENAIIKVDNLLSGTWTNGGYRSYRYWKDDTFRITKNLYQGKQQITMQAQYSTGEPWNEYFYRISCDNVITDSLDVGVTASEVSHNYSVTNLQPNLYGEINNRYDAPQEIKNRNRQLLDSVYIKIYFDNEATPSVDAPVGLFFGTGVNDAAYMKSIPCGNVNGEFYNYFSMPFWSNARIELENKSHVPVTGLSLKTSTSPNNYNKLETGYLKTYHNRSTKGYADRTDYLVADVTGNGRYVGTVIEADQNDDTVFCWLEGDERIYVDDARTPAFYGTGTEDYFNSTFYFYLDEYSLAQNGMTNSDQHFHKSMYRFHLTDPIHFNKNVRFQIEHGDYNNKLGNYQSLAFLYVQPPGYILTDSIDPGNASSELLHNYITTNNKTAINKTSAFEGEKYLQPLQQNGYSIPDSVEFTAALLPGNKGAALLRTFDYSIKNQQASVYVDDSMVGVWLNAGLNATSSFREEYFMIPGKFTLNKANIRVKLVNSSLSPWTELFYKIYSITDPAVVSTVHEQLTGSSFTILPNLTKNEVVIKNNEPGSYFTITDNTGRILQTIYDHKNDMETIYLGAYAPGIYFISMIKDDKIVSTQKIVIQH